MLGRLLSYKLEKYFLIQSKHGALNLYKLYLKVSIVFLLFLCLLFSAKSAPRRISAYIIRNKDIDFFSLLKKIYFRLVVDNIENLIRFCNSANINNFSIYFFTSAIRRKIKLIITYSIYDDLPRRISCLHHIDWKNHTDSIFDISGLLVEMMLKHQVFLGDEIRYRNTITESKYQNCVPFAEYIPLFFSDSKLIASLQSELGLDETRYKSQKVNASPSVSVSHDVELFYAYRHLALFTYHGGDGVWIPKISQCSLMVQKRLRKKLPLPSSRLSQYLSNIGINSLERVRILSPDWCSLIGHMGHLNIHLQMQELGWWDGDPILLVDESKVANNEFLNLFEGRIPILRLSQNNSKIWHELASLNPFLGVSHQTFYNEESSQHSYWNDAGALAVKYLEGRDSVPLMRRTYDQLLEAGRVPVLVEYENFMKQHGIKPHDWYVCLHIRDTATRNESHGSGEAIRSSDINTYMTTIKEIVALGGWVIRMGGNKSPCLPRMNRVIDYAHLSDKSSGLDIHLVRMSRLFVGTTSGFAYVASSLGIPMVMVNAISSVGLLWTKQTIFSLKPVFKLDEKMLSQKDVTSDDYRWAFPTFESMKAAGLIARDSTDDEILEAVREGLLISEENINHSEQLYLRAWRQSVKIDGFYGAAIPSKYFLEKYQDFLI